MNRRAVFGDFLGAAHHQLGTPAVFRTAIARGGDMTEIRHSLLRVVLALSRHVQDTTATGPQPARGHPALDGWDRAGMEAREALIHAAAALHGDTIGGRQPRAAAGSELARRLDAAALSLTYGRDLLHTHLARGPRGGLRFRSEWGSVLTTPQARWALLAEMGSFARRLAPLGEQSGRRLRHPQALRRQSLAGEGHGSPCTSPHRILLAQPGGVLLRHHPPGHPPRLIHLSPPGDRRHPRRRSTHSTSSTRTRSSGRVCAGPPGAIH